MYKTIRQLLTVCLGTVLAITLGFSSNIVAKQETDAFFPNGPPPDYLDQSEALDAHEILMAHFMSLGLTDEFGNASYPDDLSGLYLDGQTFVVVTIPGASDYSKIIPSHYSVRYETASYSYNALRRSMELLREIGGQWISMGVYESENSIFIDYNEELISSSRRDLWSNEDPSDYHLFAKLYPEYGLDVSKMDEVLKDHPDGIKLSFNPPYMSAIGYEAKEDILFIEGDDSSIEESIATLLDRPDLNEKLPSLFEVVALPY